MRGTITDPSSPYTGRPCKVLPQASGGYILRILTGKRGRPTDLKVTDLSGVAIDENPVPPAETAAPSAEEAGTDFPTPREEGQSAPVSVQAPTVRMPTLAESERVYQHFAEVGSDWPQNDRFGT